MCREWVHGANLALRPGQCVYEKIYSPVNVEIFRSWHFSPAFRKNHTPKPTHMKLKSLLIPSILCIASLQAPAALIAGYQFNETGGTSAADFVRSTTGTATLLNGATFSASKNVGLGNALTLDGSNDWASALNPVTTGQTQLTVSAWMNVAALTTWGTIVKDWSDGAPTFHFGLQNATNTISNYIGGTTNGGVISSNTVSVGINAWNHVAFTFDDVTNTQTIYLNGTAVSSTPGTTNSPFTTGGGTMGIGANTAGTQNLNGKIDDLAFFDTVLTQAEINTIITNGNNGISAIPEPSAALLGGLGMLALLRRRRA